MSEFGVCGGSKRGRGLAGIFEGDADTGEYQHIP